MNIAITTDSYLPRLGGQEMATFRLAKYLGRRGHRVRIVTTEKHPWHGQEEGGLEVIRAPHRFDLSARRRLATLLREIFREADVVHAQYCYRLAALAAPLAEELRRRFVVSLHGLGLFDNPRDSLLKRWSHRRYRSRTLSRADAIIATSEEFARVAGTYADPGRIHVVPNGVDRDEFDASRPVPASLRERFSGRRVVLAVCRLVETKGIQYLIQAAPLIAGSRPDVVFLIGGWGAMEADLKRLAASLGVGSRFEFLGRIPNRELADYLALAAVAVFPSSAESTSLACLEAMAMGRPVVASRIRGFEELLGDGERGILVRMFEGSDYQRAAPPLLPGPAVERLAEAVSRILDQPDLGRRLGETGRAYALAHYDWNLLVGRILEIYSDASAPPPE